MSIDIIKPEDIEKRSFEIITKLLDGREFGDGKDDVIKRVIHTSADFDYADNMVFSDGAVQKALDALKCGAAIVTDTNMAKSGINKAAAKQLGCEVYCFMGDEDVAAEAKKRQVTRAIVSMERACELGKNVIMAVGNAPTALLRIDELHREGRLDPALVIGVPVGFVNVVETKEIIIAGDMPYIVARGRKGGSNIAAAIVNALMYKLTRK